MRNQHPEIKPPSVDRKLKLYIFFIIAAFKRRKTTFVFSYSSCFQSETQFFKIIFYLVNLFDKASTVMILIHNKTYGLQLISAV